MKLKPMNQTFGNQQIAGVNAFQASMTIGLIGHVAHGKSSLVKALTGIETSRFKQEKERNSTIKLGYADAKIYQCSKCPRPVCFQSYRASQEEPVKCEICGEPSLELVRYISFVDCPGHDNFMATMLNGGAVMDAAILLVAANESFPQPQTSEHLVVMELLGIHNVLVIQNKIDLVPDKEKLVQQQEQIRQYLKGTVAQNAPIIPVSTQFRLNTDVVCEYLANNFKQPDREVQLPPRMSIVRSFDVNKPGCDPLQMKGGIIGGKVAQGCLKKDDLLEVRPGLISRDENGYVVAYRPIPTKVTSISSGNGLAVPGGLVGIGTTLDPKVTQGDRLVGNIAGAPGSLPEVFNKMNVSFKLLKHLHGNESNEKIGKIKEGETLLVHFGSQCSTCRVYQTTKGKMSIHLKQAMCLDVGSRLTISRRIGSSWRLIGVGQITAGQTVPIF